MKLLAGLVDEVKSHGQELSVLIIQYGKLLHFTIPIPAPKRY